MLKCQLDMAGHFINYSALTIKTRISSKCKLKNSFAELV